MRVARRLVFLAVALALIVACGTTPKARYYQNLDMYNFTMTEVRNTYAVSTEAERAKMDRELLPALNAWSKARLVWKASLNDATKEQAAMMAWAQAKTMLLRFGIIELQALDDLEGSP